MLVKRGQARTIPQYERSKGNLIITGALELSTNQMTHFYSKKKDTLEMIKLLDLLLQKYASEGVIYLSWDAGSWHMSRALYERVEEVSPTSRIRRVLDFFRPEDRGFQGREGRLAGHKSL
jgi:hypothetical protein